MEKPETALPLLVKTFWSVDSLPCLGSILSRKLERKNSKIVLALLIGSWGGLPRRHKSAGILPVSRLVSRVRFPWARRTKLIRPNL